MLDLDSTKYQCIYTVIEELFEVNLWPANEIIKKLNLGSHSFLKMFQIPLKLNYCQISMGVAG